jgi:hypothetical protein
MHIFGQDVNSCDVIFKIATVIFIGYNKLNTDENKRANTESAYEIFSHNKV